MTLNTCFMEQCTTRVSYIHRGNFNHKGTWYKAIVSTIIHKMCVMLCYVQQPTHALLCWASSSLSSQNWRSFQTISFNLFIGHPHFLASFTLSWYYCYSLFLIGTYFQTVTAFFINIFLILAFCFVLSVVQCFSKRISQHYHFIDTNIFSM